VRGYLALADETVTGYREPSARYREADSLERVGRACVLVVRVAPEGRRHGVARQLVSEAAPALRDHGIRLGVGRALDRKRLPARPLHGPERHVDRGLQLTRHTLLPITP
jgi:GNAT superfamily N-acetyltransferase